MLLCDNDSPLEVKGEKGGEISCPNRVRAYAKDLKAGLAFCITDTILYAYESCVTLSEPA